MNISEWPMAQKNELSINRKMKWIIISILAMFMAVGGVFAATDGYFAFDTSGYFNKVSDIRNPSGTTLNLTSELSYGGVNVCLADGSVYQEKLNSIVFVDPGNSSDIQNKINSCGVGCKVIIPEGTYTFSTPIRITNFQRIEGVSFETVLNYTGSGYAVIMGSTAKERGMYLANMKIITDNTTNGIIMNSTEYSKVENVLIEGSNIALEINDQAYGNTVEKNKFRSNKINVLIKNDSNANVIIDNDLTCSTTAQSSGFCEYGVKIIGGSDGVKVIDNWIEKPLTGLYVDNSLNALIEGNWFEANLNAPWNITNSANYTYIGSNHYPISENPIDNGDNTINFMYKSSGEIYPHIKNKLRVEGVLRTFDDVQIEGTNKVLSFTDSNTNAEIKATNGLNSNIIFRANNGFTFKSSTGVETSRFEIGNSGEVNVLNSGSFSYKDTSNNYLFDVRTTSGEPLVRVLDTSGNTVLRVDGSSRRTGVNVASPSTALDISSIGNENVIKLNSVGTGLHIQFAGTTNTCSAGQYGIYLDSSLNLQFCKNGVSTQLN